MLQLSPVDRVYAHVTITAELFDGSPATVAGIDAALLPYQASPDANTSWTATTYTNGIAVVLIAGPAASPIGALACPATGGTLWVRVSDNSEIQAAPAGSIAIT